MRIVSLLVTMVAFTVLDLLWLGVIARDFYKDALGPLLRDPAFLPAAALFYLLYLGGVWWWAVDSAPSVASALRRGAALGALAYGTYELTNWAVVAGWPGILVPVDWIWGTVLTASCAGLGRWSRGSRPEALHV